MLALIAALMLPFILLGMVLWQMARPRFGMTGKILAQFAAAWMFKTPKGRRVLAFVIADWLVLVVTLVVVHYV